jgi:hypothetical protein
MTISAVPAVISINAFRLIVWSGFTASSGF